MDDDRVEAVQGVRINTVVYCINGFTFQRTHVRNQTTFCKCRSVDCPARLSFRIVGEPVLTGEHNHEREDVLIQELRLRAALVQRGLNEDTPPRQIFDEEQPRFPLNVAITFEVARNIIRQARRRGVPVMPLNSLRGAADVLRQPNHQWMSRRLNENADFLGGAERIEDGVEIMHLHSAPLLNYDGTLVVTLNMSQFGLHVLRVAIQHDMDHETLGYALISRPSVAALTVSLQRLLPLHRLAAVGTIKTSYITGLRAAIMAVLPNWEISASPFLLQQSVMEEVARFGLKALLRNNEHLRHVVQRLGCVSFLIEGQRNEALTLILDFTRLEQPVLLPNVQLLVTSIRHRLDNFNITQHLPAVDEGVLRDLLLSDAVLEREELALLGVLNTPSPNFWVLYKALRRFDGRAPQLQNQQLPIGMVNRAGQQAALRSERANLPLGEFIRRVGHSISHTSRRLLTLIRRVVPFQWGNNAAPAPMAPAVPVPEPEAEVEPVHDAQHDEVAPAVPVPEPEAEVEPVHDAQHDEVAPAVPVPEAEVEPVHDAQHAQVAPAVPVPEPEVEPVHNAQHAQVAVVQPLAVHGVLEMVNLLPPAIQEAFINMVGAIMNAFLPAAQETDCIICMDRPRNMVLFPCGHAGYCQICADRIVICSVCRAEIIGRVVLIDP